MKEKDYEEEIDKLFGLIIDELGYQPVRKVHPLFRRVINNSLQQCAYTCHISSEKDQALFLSDLLELLLIYKGPGRITSGISAKFCVEVVRDLVKKNRDFLSNYLTIDFLRKNERNIWVKNRR